MNQRAVLAEILASKRAEIAELAARDDRGGDADGDPEATTAETTRPAIARGSTSSPPSAARPVRPSA